MQRLNLNFLIWKLKLLRWKIQWRRQRHPTPVLLPGKSHGWRSLVGCSPWGREESDTIERLPFHFSLLCIGEGKGNPLQCSCLENPRDRGAGWAAVYGVTQSWTRLKWLSSSRHYRRRSHSTRNNSKWNTEKGKGGWVEHPSMVCGITSRGFIYV